MGIKTAITSRTGGVALFVLTTCLKAFNFKLVMETFPSRGMKSRKFSAVAVRFADTFFGRILLSTSILQCKVLLRLWVLSNAILFSRNFQNFIMSQLLQVWIVFFQFFKTGNFFVV